MVLCDWKRKILRGLAGNPWTSLGCCSCPRAGLASLGQLHRPNRKHSFGPVSWYMNCNMHAALHCFITHITVTRNTVTHHRWDSTGALYIFQYYRLHCAALHFKFTALCCTNALWPWVLSNQLIDRQTRPQLNHTHYPTWCEREL